MDTPSATQPGAEASARPDASAAPEAPKSVHERLKAHLTPEPQPDAGRPIARAEAPEAPEPQEAEAEQPEAPEPEPQPEEAEPEQELTFSNFSELAEGLGWDVDRLMDMEAATKIDGKEGKARLRDLIKSYQLESHLNNKLMTFADEKKAHETERQNWMQERAARAKSLDIAAQVARKLLDGEFSQVNWDELRATDPNAFNAKVVDYQHRQQAIQNLVNEIGQESKTGEETALKQQQAYLAEQSRLLDSKLPEWADKAKRDKDVAEMAATLKDAYGITEAELKSVADHRQILIARDAWKWQQLQKAKPAIVNKVKTAPKLLKPGAPQSKATQENLRLQQERSRLKSTGKVSDAKPVLKKLLFG